MKIFNSKIKLIKNKKTLFLIIFAIGIGLLGYQMYINNNQTYIIENFDVAGVISSFFRPSCLSGCVSPDSERDSNCNKVYDENDKFHYECDWKCDNDKFDEFLDKNPQLKVNLENYKRCTPENEKRDCGSCVPKRTFYI